MINFLPVVVIYYLYCNHYNAKNKTKNHPPKTTHLPFIGTKYEAERVSLYFGARAKRRQPASPADRRSRLLIH